MAGKPGRTFERGIEEGLAMAVQIAWNLTYLDEDVRADLVGNLETELMRRMGRRVRRALAQANRRAATDP